MRSKQLTIKKPSINNVVKKRSFRTNTILEITIRDKNGRDNTYPINVIKKRKPTVFTKPASSDDTYYIPLRTKSLRYWNIDPLYKKGFVTDQLINSELVIFNGRKRVAGTVIAINAKTGGTTTPPPKTLPPIDE